MCYPIILYLQGQGSPFMVISFSSTNLEITTQHFPLFPCLIHRSILVYACRSIYVCTSLNILYIESWNDSVSRYIVLIGRKRLEAIQSKLFVQVMSYCYFTLRNRGLTGINYGLSNAKLSWRSNPTFCQRSRNYTLMIVRLCYC